MDDDDDNLEPTRWAFGTGFTDPLAGLDMRVPSDVDPAALATRCLMLGDDALIYSHRLQEWIARLPELEEETAIANIALDLLGQARLLLTRAGHAEGLAAGGAEGGTDRDEDQLAFFRTEQEFRNVRLVERRDEDFAELVGRLLVLSSWRLALFDRLRASADPVLAAIAAKGATELAYHRDYAAGWVVRLGDGTALSRQKMQAGLEVVWPLVDELFLPDAVLEELPATLADPVALRADVDAVLDTVLAAATLDRPTSPPSARIGGRTGRDGLHTEALGHILAPLQSVARAHPRGTW